MFLLQKSLTGVTALFATIAASSRRLSANGSSRARPALDLSEPAG
jgi:hypothetical protein